ncbi:MAG: macro domain-containing protein [Sphaerochaeta sp.]
MITYKQGNLFDEDVEALVNAVNCVGVMGGGIALQFKDRFPENYHEYEAACKSNVVTLGTMFVHETGSLFNPKYIINFPTKGHWQNLSRLSDIEEGLKDLANVIKQHNISSIALPALGCGLGGLSWRVVKGVIEQTLKDLSDVRIVVFEPFKS